MDKIRDDLIEQAITTIGVAPTLRARARANLAALSNEEIQEQIERAEDRLRRARIFLSKFPMLELTPSQSE